MKLFILIFTVLFLSIQLKAQSLDSEINSTICLTLKYNSKTAGALCSSYNYFKKINKYVNYANRYRKSIEQGKTPDDISELLGGSNKKLAGLINDFENLGSYEYHVDKEFEDISLQAYANYSIDQKIQLHDKLIDQIIQRQEHLLELEKIKEALNDYNKMVNASIDASEQIADILWEGYRLTGGGLGSFSDVFGMNALELELKLKPQLSKLRTTLKTNIEEVSKNISDEKTKTTNLKTNLGSFIGAASEQIENKTNELNKQKLELDNVASYYNLKQESLDKENEGLTYRINRNRVKYYALKEVKETMAEVFKKLQQQSSRIDQAKYALNSMVYTGCINGNSYETCTGHPEAKQSFDNAKANAQASVNNELNIYRSIEKENEIKLNNFNLSFSEFKMELKNLQHEKYQFELRQKELDSKKQILLNDYTALIKKLDAYNNFYRNNNQSNERLNSL